MSTFYEVLAQITTTEFVVAFVVLGSVYVLADFKKHEHDIE